MNPLFLLDVILWGFFITVITPLYKLHIIHKMYWKNLLCLAVLKQETEGNEPLIEILNTTIADPEGRFIITDAAT